jgi:hypothetical protein
MIIYLNLIVQQITSTKNQIIMKNLKKVSRQSLKSIKGGFARCDSEQENHGCGDATIFCCGPGGCRKISDLPLGSCII